LDRDLIEMKRLTFRRKTWLIRRQRRATNKRKAINFRRSDVPSAKRITRIYALLQKLTGQLAYRDSFYVIWSYCQYLQIADFKIPHDIEVAPQFSQAPQPRGLLAGWTLEQIAREVIQYGGDSNQEGRRLRQWGTLAQIANALRDLEGEVYRHLVGAKRSTLR
jgi:hypothetical protein